jgi:hypothetical protein
MLRKIIIIYLIIASLNVFNISALGSLNTMINFSGIILMVFIIIVDQVYTRTKMMKRNFVIPIYLIFIAVFLSMFTAFFAFRQNFQVTLFSQRDIYFYLFYFTLHVLKPEKKEFQRLIIYMGLIYLIAYLIQYFSFPTEIFDVTMRKERGTVRVYLEGSGYAMIAYYLCLQIFYTTNKFKYLFLAILFLIPIILFGARSALLTIVIGTFAQLIFSKRIRSKALIIFLVLLALVPTYLFFQDVFTSMVKASQLESAQGTENVRILAAQYFMTRFIPNDMAFLTGIGAPSAESPLGKLTMMLSETYGFYLSDIGIIGNFVTYGALFVLAVILIVFRTMFLKITLEMSYLKYFFFFEVFLMLPIAAGFAYSAPIVIICSCLYLADVSHYERGLSLKSAEPEIINTKVPVNP